MKAMIFAAGLGTRLRPLTNDRPKALVEINGVTMLERVIKYLISYGVDEIVINIHHFGDKIINFLAENNNFGITIHISDERDLLLETGGGILKARNILDDENPFIVCNADILTDMDLSEMYNQHVNSNADVTLLVAPRETSRYFVFEENNKLVGWTNIKTNECRPKELNVNKNVKLLAFGGIHIISPSIFKDLECYSNEAKFSITPFYVDICNNKQIIGYCPSKKYYWHDIGKPEALKDAEKSIK